MANRKDRNQIGILMDPSVWKKVKIIAIEKNTDASSLVGQAVEEWLKKQKV